jgi:Na+/H+ antiporter NhaB
MDTFQDIVICSKFIYPEIPEEVKQKDIAGEEIGERYCKDASQKHLENVHRFIVDSMHQVCIEYQPSVFEEMIESRSNALLMDETTMNFYQYNLKITPDEISHLAISYVLTILNICLKQSGYEKYQAISKTIKKVINDYCQNHMDNFNAMRAKFKGLKKFCPDDYPKTCD